MNADSHAVSSLCLTESRQIIRNCNVQGAAGEVQPLWNWTWVPSRDLHSSGAAGDENHRAGTVCLMKKLSLTKPL